MAVIVEVVYYEHETLEEQQNPFGSNPNAPGKGFVFMNWVWNVNGFIKKTHNSHVIISEDYPTKDKVLIIPVANTI